MLSLERLHSLHERRNNQGLAEVVSSPNTTNSSGSPTTPKIVISVHDSRNSSLKHAPHSSETSTSQKLQAPAPHKLFRRHSGPFSDDIIGKSTPLKH